MIKSPPFGCGATGLYGFSSLETPREIANEILRETNYNSIVFAVLNQHQRSAIEAFRLLGGYCVIEKINHNSGNKVGLYFLARKKAIIKKSKKLKRKK